MVASPQIRQAIKVSAEEAAGLVESGMWVDYGFGMGQPDAFDRALAARTGRPLGGQDPLVPDHAAAGRDRRRPDRRALQLVQLALLRL